LIIPNVRGRLSIPMWLYVTGAPATAGSLGAELARFLALAKQIQIAMLRSRRSPEWGGMIVAGGMVASWQAVMVPSVLLGSGGLLGMSVPLDR
jgi:hypothetical protein